MEGLLLRVPIDLTGDAALPHLEGLLAGLFDLDAARVDLTGETELARLEGLLAGLFDLEAARLEGFVTLPDMTSSMDVLTFRSLLRGEEASDAAAFFGDDALSGLALGGEMNLEPMISTDGVLLGGLLEVCCF